MAKPQAQSLGQFCLFGRRRIFARLPIREIGQDGLEALSSDPGKITGLQGTRDRKIWGEISDLIHGSTSLYDGHG